MEDSVSVKSSDSVATSEEYEFVNGSSVSRGGLPGICEQPLLNIANNGNLDDLQKTLKEVLNEDCSSLVRMDHPLAPLKSVPVTQTIKKVGQSQFYEVDVGKHAETPSQDVEKTDSMKYEDDAGE
ncbi:hypothetical protein PR048_003850 [Dryococelus australis]|uniref:Uncharacterized protein n=1 Tax=Dryococelus australis TaxID=614101 RepID=A0ABQ9IP85_9NEOP|nr:hypothetical protein PR048_003850 [Dryococelus australis]